ncbi:metallophosphoesterase [Urechidicola vernalis]|uniref:Phosphoesterase n=1 Tax=Urechidicola vernalis TaxID=3075600 RepID=A0ABU2Y5I7_9FLAO|nr:metallophosphoesterase [Urechidicola sp. P050]MDT0553462.1 phosphoesterase [Urechidicola sp. P050]
MKTVKHITIFFLLVLLLTNCNIQNPSSSKEFSIGIVSDCQYCDCEIKWDRYFKKSPERLRQAVEELNKHDLEYTIHLGDFIDKEFKSFDSILPTWNLLKSKSYHVLGNHDFDVADSLKPFIAEKMGLKKRYYSFEVGNWKFIVLDGTDLSTYGSEVSKQKEADNMLLVKEKDSLPYAMFYNGGLSSEQIKWVKSELELSKNNNQNVGFYCHFPANPIDNHNFWNVNEFNQLTKNYPNVKVFMNGHNHAGSYLEKDGIHYITFKGMVDTENESAFATATFTKDSILIKGFGREINRSLKIN